jgi:hypothetical protein
VALLVHDVGRDEDAAGPVALLSLSAPRRRPVAGRAWQAVAILQNVGPSSVEVGLDISVEGSPDRRRETFAVPAGAVRAVRLPMRGLPAGLARVRVAADGPAAAPGAEGWMALPVSGGASVWLLGRAADHGLLAAALAPAGPGILTGLSAETRTAAELPEALRRGPPAMLAATARQLADPAVDAAASAYALAGGVLLVTPGRRDTDVPGTLPAWCGAAWGPPAASEAGFPLVVLEPGDAIWDDLRAADGSVRLPGALARRVAPLSAGTNALSLAGLADGRVALVRARLGRGRVYTMGFPFDPAWTTLPLRAAGLALAQALALTAPAATGTVTDVAAGEPLPLPLLAAPPAATARVAVRALAGDALRWQGPPADLAPAPRAGVYEIDAGSGVCWAAVRGDAAEAAVARVPAPQAPLLVGAPVRVFSYANGNGTVQSARAARSGSQLFAPLLAAALAAMLLETVVANRRSVRGRTTADGAAGPGRAGGRGEA